MNLLPRRFVYALGTHAEGAAVSYTASPNIGLLICPRVRQLLHFQLSFCARDSVVAANEDVLPHSFRHHRLGTRLHQAATLRPQVNSDPQGFDFQTPQPLG